MKLNGFARVGVAAVLAGFMLLCNGVKGSLAEGEDKVIEDARCANRLSIALLGKAVNGSEIDLAPQAKVESMLSTPEFQERFARFINSRMNPAPGASPEEDGAYHLAKYILQNGKPWKELYNGPYSLVVSGNGNNRTVSVQTDLQGLGYFRTQAWLQRYAGNELTGLKLNSAYRMLNNVLGLKLLATSNAPGADVSAAGRAAPACKGCHFDGWYALDKTAQVLSRVQRQNNNITFTPSDGMTKEVLGGVMAKDDGELINAMVDSDQFIFAACRNVFNFLYGRDENSCEAAVFDGCMDALRGSGLIQSAVASVAKDSSFCQ